MWIVAESMPYLKYVTKVLQPTKGSHVRIGICLIASKIIPNILKALQELTIEGTVIVSFVIDIYGNMKDITVSRDMSGGCGQAAINY
ncbi:MAG: hypothetical protein IPJ39_22200 [Saprospiraceae bacterium]|nr:hypothetical protein [Saprospiraceae bacterium]